MYESPYPERRGLSLAILKPPMMKASLINPPSLAVRAKISGLARMSLLAIFCIVATAAFSPMMTPVLHLIPWREAGHFGAFFVITCAAAVSFPKVRLSRIALLGAVGGALIELAQAMPWIGRDCTLLDWAADVAGVLAVIAVCTAMAFRQAYAAKVRPLRRPDDAHRSFRVARANRWPGR